jgi:hypothetical protein
MTTYEELNPTMHASKLLPPLILAKLHEQVERTEHLSASPGGRERKGQTLLSPRSTWSKVGPSAAVQRTSCEVVGAAI